MKFLSNNFKAINKRVGSTLLGFTIFATSNMIFAPASNAEIKKARSTEEFIDSIGIVTQVWNTQTAYGQFSDVVKPRLRELGIHHIRTNVLPGDKKTIAKLKELTDMGIKLNLVMDPRKLSLTETIKLVEYFGNSVESVEGPNEWNHNLTKTYNGKSFPVGLRNYQSDLYKAIRSDPDTAHIPVIGPALSNAFGINSAVTALGTVSCDINNAHNYPLGRQPINPQFYHQLPYYGMMCGSDKPLIATETGYTNAIKASNGVSERAAARYWPRLLMAHFNNGFKRTYIYELMNDLPNPALDDKEHNWGLVRDNGSKKPAFEAVKNLIDILDNSDVAATSTQVPLSSLDYDIKGDMTDIHQTLLQKKDGRLYLALWKSQPSYNLTTKSNVDVPYSHITINFNTKISQAKIYRPNWKSGALKQVNNPSRLRVGVSDMLLLIELTPQG